jgi:hypothetical protein
MTIANAIETTTAPSTAFTAFVLGQIRVAKLRAELAANQADMAITALSGGVISPEQAILILAECGVEVSS